MNTSRQIVPDASPREGPVFVFTIAIGAYKRLFADCIRSQRQYCERHGYDFLVVDRAPRKLLAEEAAWLKIYLLIYAMRSSRRWIGFVDSDCEIRATAPPFHTALPEIDPGAAIYAAHGFSGRINSGVLFARNSPEARSFFESIVLHADDDIPAEDQAAYENGHVIAFGKKSPHVKVVDYHWNNNRSLDATSHIQHYSQGLLRDGYLARTFPVRYGSPFLVGAARRANRVVQRCLRGRSQPSPISNRLAQLVPFYRASYAAFRD